MASQLFELKVFVEADDWRDVATLVTSVDRALDPHHRRTDGNRRWSVVANRVPGGEADALLSLVGAPTRTV